MNIHKPLRLMIPGPVSVHPDVLAALGGPVQPHYGPQFRELFSETLLLLKQLFRTEGEVFLMAGSGTAAVDACIGSSLQAGEKIIVGNNGFFGQRLVEIAERYGLDVVQVCSAPGTPLAIELFEEAVAQNPDAKAIALVHLETSTTILNPVDQIRRALAGRDILLIVDAVSSIGGVPFDIDGWGVDLCAGATQKCLGSVPGLAPITVSERAWDAINRLPEKHHGWYSDLRIWRKYKVEWGDWHPTPVTMPVNLIAALNVALHQLHEEGIETRLERFRKLALQLRTGLEGLGLELYTPEKLMTPVLTAAYMPNGVESCNLITFLEEQHRIKISPGLGPIKEKMFRVGHMSPVVTAVDVNDVIFGIGEFLQLREGIATWARDCD